MKKYEYEFRALGTSCSIAIIAWSDEKLNAIINDAYDLISNFENEFSRFKETSLLSKLNREKKLEMTDDFWFLIQRSKEIYKITDWFFNPLINISNIWYSQNFEDNNFKKSEVLENISFDNIKIYWNTLEIWEDMNLDFWSIAKWYLAEKISKYINAKWFVNNLVNIWWDIYASWTNLEKMPWNIAISDPENSDIAIENIKISNSSISTSWTYIRNWKIDDKSYHHIKNPYSQKQEEELVSATIIHEYWYMTDALATAVIAMWAEKAIEFCKKNNIKFLFIMKDWLIIKRLK